MTEPVDLLAQARAYHETLPTRIRAYAYLNARGIPDPVIALHLVGWDGERITIPIFDREGRLAFFKLAKDPEDEGPGPKMLSPAGSRAELYGWERVLAKPPRIVIAEGEFDRLVLEGQGIAAVTSTGGASVFHRDWADAFEPIEEVYVCYDRDRAGHEGALRVVRLIPHARLVELPEEVGPSGDVTDFFVRLGKTKDDFLALLATARPAPVRPEQLPGAASAKRPSESPWAKRIALVKALVPIAELVARYVALHPSGTRLLGLCPFHDDHTPSLVVYPAHGRFVCFGCGSRGDVFDFLMAIEHLTFSQALEALERLIPRHGGEDAA